MHAVYIETSVVSYYVARASRDALVAGHQQATIEFWRRLGADFEPYVSALVIQEAGKGDAGLAQKRLDAVSAFPVIETMPIRLTQACLKTEGRALAKAPQGKLLRRLSARKIAAPVLIG